jgi:hypothetical protein
MHRDVVHELAVAQLPEEVGDGRAVVVQLSAGTDPPEVPCLLLGLRLTDDLPKPRRGLEAADDAVWMVESVGFRLQNPGLRLDGRPVDGCHVDVLLDRPGGDSAK